MSAAIPAEQLIRYVGASAEQRAVIERYLLSGNAQLLTTPVGPVAGNVQYCLRKEAGVWALVFEGRNAIVRDCRAMELVDYLLRHPPEDQLHAAEWEQRVDGNPLMSGLSLGEGEFSKLRNTGAEDIGGVIEERTGRDFEGRITLPKLKAQLAELRQASMDETLPESEREDARQQLLALLRAHARGGKLASQASRAVDRVRKQLKALIKELQQAENEVLKAFGQHLEDYLWLPSMGGRKRAGAICRPGCFTYEPPARVKWNDCL